MKRRFSVVYFLAGCASVWLLWVGGGESDLVSVVGGSMALLCFFTAWQGWFNGGVVWKILHTLFGVVTVGLCLAAWGYVMPYLTGMSRRSDVGIGEMLVGVAAALLTPPAAAYVVTATMWLRSRGGPAQASAATSAKPQQRFGRRTVVGAVLAALGIAMVLAWLRYGSDVRCELGTDNACYTAARNAATRGDLDAALAIYDRVIERQKAAEVPGVKLVSIAWSERDAILIRQGAYARLDAIALEACPDRPVACRDVINVQDQAGQRARAERAFRRYCEMGGGEACVSYGKWLVEKGEIQVALAVLQKYCDEADIMACLEYGTQLAHARQFDDARAALKRSCVLHAEAKGKAKEPSMYAVCQSYINTEKSFVTPAQLREDAREVCLAYLPQCAEVAGVIATDKSDPDAAWRIVEEACARHGVTGPTSAARICSSTEGYLRPKR